MNVTSVWDKLSRLVVILFFSACLVGIFFWYLPLIQQNERMRKEVLGLDLKVREQEKIERKQRSDFAAMSDPRTVERLAREKLSYAKTNETIFRFESR